MLALIRMSSRNGGSGVIIASTMPSTAIGNGELAPVDRPRRGALRPVAAVGRGSRGRGCAWRRRWA